MEERRERRSSLGEDSRLSRRRSRDQKTKTLDDETMMSDESLGFGGIESHVQDSAADSTCALDSAIADEAQLLPRQKPHQQLLLEQHLQQQAAGAFLDSPVSSGGWGSR